MTTLAIPSPGPLQRILTSNSIPEAKGLELLNTFGPFFATAARSEERRVGKECRL